MAALASSGTALARGLAATGPATEEAASDSSTVPATYRRWQAHARALLEPLARLLVPGQARLAIHGPASANGANSDRLETVARPMLLAAHYLQSPPESDDPTAAAFRTRLADGFRDAFLAGTAPGGPQAWGPDANYHQIHVEMGLFCLALQIAPEHLWAPLTRGEQDQVATWLSSARHTGYVDNNHYFMGIHILEFLRAHGYGQRSDAALVDTYFDRLEAMHRGGGWFQDGINQAFDYYNAYAYAFYGLWWARLHGKRDTARAERWRDHARAFTRDYEHFFAATGEHPAFGRSITYRFNSIATFGLTVLENCSDLPLGRLRRLCTRNLEFFLRHPIYQDQGCLTLGWLDRFDASAELYSGAGSPYWAAKGFSPLLLPPSHAFWNVPEEPLLSERGDYVRVIAPAGLVLRSAHGAVELLNAGSQISNTNLRYGAWKWSKTAYRTGMDFTCAFPAASNWSPDSALTIELPDGRVYGRHSTVATELTETHLGYSWALGYAPDQTNVGVDTTVWWRAGWLLQLHRLNALQPVRVRLGGYALPLHEPRCTRSATATHLIAWDEARGRGTALQPLYGLEDHAWDARLDDSTPRAHLAAPYHVTPLAVRKNVVGTGFIAALAWAGAADQSAESAPWNLVAANAGAWRLTHPRLGDWNVRHPALPALPVST